MRRNVEAVARVKDGWREPDCHPEEPYVASLLRVDSATKDLLDGAKEQVLRFAQDDV